MRSFKYLEDFDKVGSYAELRAGTSSRESAVHA